MNCLHCGDCCKRMCPLHPGKPCEYLIEQEDFYFCDNYDRRPEQCINHSFPATVCPIGLDVLKIKTPAEKNKRIDRGYELIKERKKLLYVLDKKLYKKDT